MSFLYAETTCILMSLLSLVMANIPEQCRISREPYMEVDCSNSKLDHIPDGIPCEAVSLNFSHNNIKLDKPAKRSCEVDHVVNLDLSNNRISSIHPQFFSCFTNLKYLDLSHNFLKEVNFLLPLSLRALNISMNSMEGLQTEIFKEQVGLMKKEELDTGQHSVNEKRHSKYLAELSNLTLLNISGNSILELNQDCFRGMRKLKQLYLQSNDIQHLNQSDVFSENADLEIIDISQNNISHIKSGFFIHLDKLKYLCLSENKLRTVPSDLPSLDWLDISNNSITHVSEETSQKDLYQQEVLLMGMNPFHCDCKLHWLKEYHDTREYQVKFLQGLEEKFIPVCASPPYLAYESWSYLSSNLFSCEEIHSGIDHDSPSTSGNNGSEEPDLIVVAQGQDYVKLKWIMGNQYTRQSSSKYQLSFHQFGQRHRREKVIFHSSVAKYTLNNLQSVTAYIICLKEIDNESDAVIQDFDCVEIVTNQKPNELYRHAQFCAIVIFTIACVFFIRKITDIYFGH